MTPDDYVRWLIRDNPNLLIPHYLIHSWLYYERHVSILTDTYYDEMCKELAEKLPTVEHLHKHLVDPEALRAGTAYHLKDSYPGIIPGAATYLYYMFNPKEDPCPTRRKALRTTRKAMETLYRKGLAPSAAPQTTT